MSPQPPQSDSPKPGANHAGLNVVGPSADDLALIACLNRGGADAAAAFDQLFQRHSDWVANLAFRFTGDRDLALDVTQEVFLYFLRKFPGFELTAKLTTFLYPAVKNLAIAHRKKAARFASNDDALKGIAGNVNDEAAAAAERKVELTRVMASLSEGHREVLLLRFVDGFSLQEVADALGIALGTVKSRLHNALATLRKDPLARKYFGQDSTDD